MSVSPLAVVDLKAQVADDAEIGPFCVIGPEVTIGGGCRLLSHVVVTGHTTLGRNNTVYPHAVLGTPPQDRKYRGGTTRLEIGEGNQIREAATIHLGTEKGGGVTRVGGNNLIMVNAHVGHDAQIGSGCTLSNNVMIAGHCIIGDHVVMAGGVGIHHFVTVGEHAFLGGYARIHHDVPPFVKVDGADDIRGLNRVGLVRAGFAEEDIDALEEACRQLFYREKPVAVVLAEFDTMNGVNRHVKRMVEFLRQRNQGRHGRYLESLRAK